MWSVLSWKEYIPLNLTAGCFSYIIIENSVVQSSLYVYKHLCQCLEDFLLNCEIHVRHIIIHVRYIITVSSETSMAMVYSL